MKIGDFLTYHPVDYVGEILVLSPHGVIRSEAAYRQIVNGSQGTTRRVATTGTRPDCSMQIQWDTLTKIEAEAIEALYLDPVKAFGQARSFAWLNPYDAVVYSAAFSGALSDQYKAGVLDVSLGLKLQILGLANLLANGDFSLDAVGETDPLNWDVTQEGTADSAEVVSADHGNMFEVTTSNITQSVTLTSSEFMAVIDGRIYNFSLPVRTVSGIGAATVRVLSYDADRAEIGSQNIIVNSDIGTTLTTLTAQLKSSEMPTGTAFIKLQITMQDDTVGVVQIGSGGLDSWGMTVSTTEAESPVSSVIVMEDTPPTGTVAVGRVTDTGGQVWAWGDEWECFVTDIGDIWDTMNLTMLPNPITNADSYAYAVYWAVGEAGIVFLLNPAVTLADIPGLTIWVNGESVYADPIFDYDTSQTLNSGISIGSTQTKISINGTEIISFPNVSGLGGASNSRLQVGRMIRGIGPGAVDGMMPVLVHVKFERAGA